MVLNFHRCEMHNNLHFYDHGGNRYEREAERFLDDLVEDYVSDETG